MASAFIVWRGYRDYEENLVVCSTRKLAEQYCVDHEVKLGDHPHGFDNSTSVGINAAQNNEPWGIEERDFLT